MGFRWRLLKFRLVESCLVLMDALSKKLASYGLHDKNKFSCPGHPRVSSHAAPRPDGSMTGSQGTGIGSTEHLNLRVVSAIQESC